MSGCCIASLFCPVRCSSHVVFVQFFPTAYGGAGYFYQIIRHFSSREGRGGRSCTCGRTLYKGPTPFVFLMFFDAVEQGTKFPSAFFSLSLSLVQRLITLSLFLIVLHSISILLIRSLSSAATLTRSRSH